MTQDEVVGWTMMAQSGRLRRFTAMDSRLSDYENDLAFYAKQARRFREMQAAQAAV